MSQARTDRLARPSTSWQHGKPARAATSRLVPLVFPLIMLMPTMSAGGMGGGAASAVARALGAGRRDDADALAWHAKSQAWPLSRTSTMPPHRPRPHQEIEK